MGKPKNITTVSLRHGFTLVELLIVIVVIAILAAIITVSYSGIRERAIATTAQSDLTNDYKLLLNYQIPNGSWPTGISTPDGQGYGAISGSCSNPGEITGTTICLAASGKNWISYVAPTASTPDNFVLAIGAGDKEYAIDQTGVTSEPTCTALIGQTLSNGRSKAYNCDNGTIFSQ